MYIFKTWLNNEASMSILRIQLNDVTYNYLEGHGFDSLSEELLEEHFLPNATQWRVEHFRILFVLELSNTRAFAYY